MVWLCGGRLVLAGGEIVSRRSKIAKRGGVVVLLDGTLIGNPRRTGADNRRNFSGKHKAHGLLFLALTDEKGNL
ncbi:hypothetical protein ADL01_26990, partial [Streptomyces sp. NRRL WC-3618]